MTGRTEFSGGKRDKKRDRTTQMPNFTSCRKALVTSLGWGTLGLVISLLIFGCSKESVTEPEPETNEFLEIGSTTIGPSGGNLSAGGFTLTVPAGAFSSELALTLYSSLDYTPFDANGISPTYKLTGLPRDYSQPLSVSVPYQGTLEEQSYIAAGAKALDIVSGEDDVFYVFLPATDSSGQLTSELPVPDMSSTAGHGPDGDFAGADIDLLNDIFISVVTVFRTKIVDNGPFKIVYPLLLEDTAEDIKSALGISYYMFHENFPESPEIRVCGGPWEAANPDTAMVTITNRDTGRFVAIGSNPFSPGQNRRFLVINGPKITTVDIHERTARVASSYFLLFSSWNDGEFYNSGHYWFHRAASLWSQKCLLNVDESGPFGFLHNEMAPFRGPISAIGEFLATDAYGCGMAPVIKYLVDRNGYSCIDDMCDEFCTGGKSGAHIMLDHADASVSEWFPDFLNRYLKGEIYGVESSTFLSNLAGQYVVRSADDTLHVFSQLYNDLSAKLYLVSLSYPDIDQGAKIRFTGESSQDNWTLLIFGRTSGGSLVSLGQGSDVALDKTVKELMNSGYKELVAAVVNYDCKLPQFDGRSNISLKVALEKTGPSFKWRYCTVEIIVNVRWVTSTGSDYWGTGTFILDGVGSFIGNRFLGAWEDQDCGDYKCTGSVDVLLTSDGAAVQSFSIQDTMTSATEEYTIALAGTNLSKKDEQISFVSFGEDGLVSASHITTLVWHMVGDYTMEAYEYTEMVGGKVYVYMERYPPSANPQNYMGQDK